MILTITTVDHHIFYADWWKRFSPYDGNAAELLKQAANTFYLPTYVG